MSGTEERVETISITDIYPLVLELFDMDGHLAAEWMTSIDIPFFQGQRPVDLLKDPQGRYKVWVCLQRAIHGVYS